jgi:phage terminase large subunit
MEEILEEIIDVELDYSPRAVFQEFHDRTERWAVIVAHRRCGKTVAVLNDMIYRALNEDKPNAQYAYIAPYYAQAKSIAWSYLLRFTELCRKQANQSELWVELINGAKIRLFGGDNPDALRGNYLDGVVLDEMADMKPRLWGEIVRPLLADRLGWATFIGTPKGHNGFYEIFTKAEQQQNWFVKVLRASQTKILPQEELDDARSMMTEDQYEAEFECNFESAILGAYYGREMRELTDEGRITDVQHDPMFKVHTAWDLGYSDDTSIWWYQVIHGEIRLLDYHFSNGEPVEYYANVITEAKRKYGYEYGTHWLPHDARAKTLASGGKSIIEQISNKIPIESFRIVPSLSLQDGIQASRMALKRCWFDFKCQDGIECLRQYQREFDEDKKVFRDKPRHDWTSHGADAFRMMAIAWKDEEKTITKDHSIRGVVVGENETTLNELWAASPIRRSGRI